MRLWAAIDGFIQRAVNSAMFAIMRATGWPRSLIRYRIAMGPLLVAGVVMSGIDAAKLGIGWGCIMFVVFVVLTALAAPREQRADEAAERSGLGRASRFRTLSTLFAVEDAVFAALGYPYKIPFAVFWALSAFYEYAAATPPNPPTRSSLRRFQEASAQ